VQNKSGTHQRRALFFPHDWPSNRIENRVEKTLQSGRVPVELRPWIVKPTK